MSIYTAILAPFVAAVIVILAADVALGTRDLPDRALFLSLELILLVAYLVCACVVLNPLLLMVAWLALITLLAHAYHRLGVIQARAIALGLEEWGIRSRWRARLGALLLAYLPVLGSGFAVWGAARRWHWPTRTGMLRFFGPLAAILAPPLAFLVYLRLREAGIVE